LPNAPLPLIGTVQATPSCLTFEVLIWLWTPRVLPASAFGIVQPVAVGPPLADVVVVSGVVVAGVDAVVTGVLVVPGADVLALSLLPPPQPATASAVAAASAMPAGASSRGRPRPRPVPLGSIC